MKKDLEMDSIRTWELHLKSLYDMLLVRERKSLPYQKKKKREEELPHGAFWVPQSPKMLKVF